MDNIERNLFLNRSLYNSNRLRHARVVEPVADQDYDTTFRADPGQRVKGIHSSCRGVKYRSVLICLNRKTERVTRRGCLSSKRDRQHGLLRKTNNRHARSFAETFK